jgi:copper chaperone
LSFAFAARLAKISKNGKDFKLMRAKIKIDGMHCNSCAADIEETLAERAGVKEAKVCYKDKFAEIEFDENAVEPAAFIKTIQDLGYQAAFVDNE